MGQSCAVAECEMLVKKRIWCGYQVHSAALDFDHLPGTIKVRDIKHGNTLGWEALQVEIAKCEVVCANCHRIRTFLRNREGGDVNEYVV